MARAVLALGVPLGIACVLGAAVAFSFPARGSLPTLSKEKHTLNVCQVYAYGYEQRHDDFTGSPWTDCQPLMRRDFGQAQPTFTAAFEANPSAITEHLLWNARIAPYAVQLLLFDAMSADQRHSPDYAPVTTGSGASRIGLVAVAVFLAGGAWFLWRERHRWWEQWLRERAWGWLALAALGFTAVTVMIWQRPRPPYLFSLTVLLLAAIGMGAMAYADRWPLLRGLRVAPPLLAVTLLLALPPHYDANYQTAGIGRPGRPLKETVDHLYPLRDEVGASDASLLSTYSGAACDYIGGVGPCVAVSWDQVLNAPAVALRQTLHKEGVDFVYLDQADLADPRKRQALELIRAEGWRPIAAGLSGQTWVLLERREARRASSG